MYYKYKIVKNTAYSTFNDMKLFEQNSYCFDYLKNRFPDIDDIELKAHSDIASACFRQAFEYYYSANSASLTTSPLLYSYSLNNLLKGVCYLISFDEEILKGFKSHGFKVDSNYLDESNALNSCVTIMKRDGAVHSLLRLYDNHLIKQEIPFFKILRHIPDLDDIYFRTVKSISLIAKDKESAGNIFCLYGNKIDEETKNILSNLHLTATINSISDECICEALVANKEYFNDGVFMKENVYYKSYMNIPDMFAEGLKDINVSFYCYLLIMSYGMLVRYNANIWENFIDKKTSSFSTLLELSIYHAIINFYYQMHFLLFNFYYEDESYKVYDIKKIINESTAQIMNNISNEIIRENVVYGEKRCLPWREKVR